MAVPREWRNLLGVMETGSGQPPRSQLFGGPVGGFVVSVGGELVGLGAVGEHGPDLARTGAGGFEDDVAAVRGPAGAFVAAHIASEFEDATGGDVHDVDVVIAGGTAPRKGE